MRRALIITAITIPVLLVAFVAAGYVSDEVVGSERVSRGVAAENIDLSRTTSSQAVDEIAKYEATLNSQPVSIVLEGNQLTLDPNDVGLEVDEDAVVANAMTVRRDAGFLSNARLWLGTFTSKATVPIPVTIDEEALTEILNTWSDTVLDTPAYEGAVKIVDGKPSPEYPQAGLRIDIEAAVPLITEQLYSQNRTPVTLPLVPLDPAITPEDVDEALREAHDLIGSSVVLRSPKQTGTIIFTEAGLATALRSEVVHNSPAALEVSLDTETLRDIAARSEMKLRIPPVEATFAFDEETRELSVVPSVVGQRIDLERIPEVVVAAALGNGYGIVPMTDGDQPELTTEAAEAMGPFGEVSSFTTYHPCCQSRVKNIQLLADEMRGALVLPGEVLSINERAGKRTTAEGYVRAGAIIDGRVQCCDSAVNIGGGTSQFATTFYNAVFFGCYEDVFHQPHSLYFSRYPFVREATLGFPAPDVKFRNDSEAVVYVHTEYTGGSITVSLFGNNGGRTCTSERSGNTITRVMEHPDGSVTTQDWTWGYRKPKPEPTETTTTTATPTTVTPTTSATTTTTSATTTTTSATTTTTSATTTTTSATVDP